MYDQILSLLLPRGFLSWLLKAAVWLYLFRTSGPFGSHTLLLTHIGRKTRQIHQTVIE